MQIELRNYKQFKGREGYGFSATLYIAGVSRGNVFDDANGGCLGYDDYRAGEEVDQWARSFPHEFDFEVGDQLINVLAYRADASKKYARHFAESLCFVKEDGTVGITKKADEATRARWMADPKTKTALKVKRFITDRNEFLDLIMSEDPNLCHPALDICTANKRSAPVDDAAKKLKEADKDEPKVKNTGDGSGGTGTSKLDRCRVIYNSNMTASRKDMIAMFITQCDCTAAGASTYYQKLKTS